MTIEELEDALEGALARIKRLEDALLAVSLDPDVDIRIADIAIEAMKTDDD